MDNYNIYNLDEVTSPSRSTVSFQALITKVYLWMTMALAITALTSLVVATNESVIYALLQNRALFWGCAIAELALVFILSARIMRMSFATAGVIFGLYSILNGVTLSFLLLINTAESVASTFFITAATFGAMSLTGYVIKRDLGAVGRFLFMALIGLIIATIVNIFVASSALSWVITYAGVIIFCGLTAYDTQKMKVILQNSQHMGESNAHKIALLCSLTLYLDFINLFIYLLRIFGNRR